MKYEIAFYILSNYNMKNLARFMPESFIDWVYRNGLGM
jgi:hypothetical protein